MNMEVRCNKFRVHRYSILRSSETKPREDADARVLLSWMLEAKIVVATCIGSGMEVLTSKSAGCSNLLKTPNVQQIARNVLLLTDLTLSDVSEFCLGRCTKPQDPQA